MKREIEFMSCQKGFGSTGIDREKSMKMAASLLMFLFTAVGHAEPGQITLRTGIVMEYNEIQVEGEAVTLKIESGQFKVKKEQMSEKDQKKFFGPPEEEVKEVAAAPVVGALKEEVVPTVNPMPVPAVVPESSKASSEKGESKPPAVVPEPVPSKGVEEELAWPEGEAFSSYPEFKNVPESDLPATDVKSKFKTGEYKIKIEGAEDMEVAVFYRIPLNEDKPAPSANNLVFYCPYPLERNKITSSHQLIITDVLGCSMFTFHFNAKGEDLGNPKRCYWSPESGWLKAAMEAREKICQEFGLEKRKLILMGESAGSNMAQALAVTYPEEVEAAAMIGGQEYQPLPAASTVKWLVTNTRGDSTTTANKALAAGLKKIGASVIFTTPAPIHKDRANDLYNHVPGPQSRELVNGFIWGILQDREAAASGNSSRIWPYVVSIGSKDKFKIELNRAAVSAPDQVLLPSAAFAEAWSRVAPKVQKVTLPSSSSGGSRVFLGFPGREAPKGVVVYYDSLSYLNYGSTIENVATLAEMGYAVIAPADFGSKAAAPEQYLKTALTWIQSQRVLHNRPLHLCGVGKPSLAFLNATAMDLAVNPASFGLLEMQLADIQPDYRRALFDFSKKCPFVVALRVDKEKKEDGYVQRLAESVWSKSAEKRGSKRVELGAKDSPAKGLGAGLLAFSEVMEKADEARP